MINLAQAYKCLMYKVPVYWVHAYMRRYLVDEVLIEEILQEGMDSVPQFVVKNRFTGSDELVNDEGLFLDVEEAKSACNRAQEERGFVTISQKEYNELIALKNKFQLK